MDNERNIPLGKLLAEIGYFLSDLSAKDRQKKTEKILMVVREHLNQKKDLTTGA